MAASGRLEMATIIVKDMVECGIGRMVTEYRVPEIGAISGVQLAIHHRGAPRSKTSTHSGTGLQMLLLGA